MRAELRPKNLRLTMYTIKYLHYDLSRSFGSIFVIFSYFKHALSVIEPSTEQYFKGYWINQCILFLFVILARSISTLPTSLGSLGLELERRLTRTIESFFRQCCNFRLQSMRTERFSCQLKGMLPLVALTRLLEMVLCLLLVVFH